MYSLLIVDDEAMIRKGLRRMIPWESLGFSVVDEAASSAKALAILEREQVDVLLTDIQMPGNSGLHLTEQVKRQHPGIKIIIISGYDRFDYALSALRLQVEDYILKPIDPKLIEETFRALKEKMDREREASQEQKQRFRAEDEYGILRLIGNELQNPRNLQSHLGNAGYISLVLLHIPFMEESKWIVFSQELFPLLRDHFCISTDVLFAVFLPSDRTDHLVKGLTELFGAYPELGQKIVVSQEFHHPNDAYGAFLVMVEQLRKNEGGTLYYMKENDRKAESEAVVEAKKQLILDLEEGRGAALSGDLDKLFEAVRQHRLFTGILLCSNLLLDIANHFRLADTTSFQLVNASTPPPETMEELETMTKEDLDLVLEQLRSSGETSSALLVQRAKQYIQANYTNCDFSLTDLAKALSINYNYLSTVFSRETGTSLKSYLTVIRMEQARKLILERKQKIYHIAEMVGYSSPGYFTDVFRKHFGVSPKEYTQTLGGGRDE